MTKLTVFKPYYLCKTLCISLFKSVSYRFFTIPNLKIRYKSSNLSKITKKYLNKKHKFSPKKSQEKPYRFVEKLPAFSRKGHMLFRERGYAFVENGSSFSGENKK